MLELISEIVGDGLLFLAVAVVSLIILVPAYLAGGYYTLKLIKHIRKGENKDIISI